MNKFEVWSEGYAATGESGQAHLMGTYEGETFSDAVEAMLKDYEESGKWKDIRGFYAYRPGHVNSEHTIWACCLYDNEADARKSFG